MFEILQQSDGEVKLAGRFDASRIEEARSVFSGINSTCTVDFSDVTYISSAGLGVLLETQKRLTDAGEGLVLIRMSPNVRQIFEYAGFHRVFQIE